jgi:tetratricopeptide (TPR) repeat protein
LKGSLDDARLSFEGALDILEPALGPEHPAVARPLNNLAIVLGRIGEPEQAKDLYERVMAIESAALPPDHPNHAANLDNLASAYLGLGDNDQALLLQKQAIAAWERIVDPNHPSMASSLSILGSIHFERSEGAEMLAAYERALAILETHEGTQPGELEARFVIAQVLVLRGGDRERAVGLAKSALEGYRAAGNAEGVSGVEEWLEGQGEAVE